MQKLRPLGPGATLDGFTAKVRPPGTQGCQIPKMFVIGIRTSGFSGLANKFVSEKKVFFLLTFLAKKSFLQNFLCIKKCFFALFLKQKMSLFAIFYSEKQYCLLKSEFLSHF